MTNTKVELLIEKLDKIILKVDGSIPSVSPTLSMSGTSKSLPDIIITSDLDVDNLDQDKLVLVHTLLHKFYSLGSKNLAKHEIEKLHKRVKEKLDNHQDFDRLDKVD